MRNIRLNFLPFESQDFGIKVYRKKIEENNFISNADYYDLPDLDGNNAKYEIVYQEEEGYEEYKLPPYFKTGIVCKNIFDKLKNATNGLSNIFVKSDDEYNRRLFVEFEKHPKGRKCIWMEPYFLKSKQLWGIQIGFQFLVNDALKINGKATIDRDILIASGTLNAKGQSNFDFYLFKHNYFNLFIKNILPGINNKLEYKLTNELYAIDSNQLKAKEYIFKNGAINNSSYIGLTKNEPLERADDNLYFNFIYRKQDRDYAVALLKGLRGESYPSQFSGLNKIFKIDFSNERIKGISIDDFDDTTIDNQIEEIKKSDKNILPVIITLTKKDDESDRLYFKLKHKFTNAGIPCQVVTKELIGNENSIKYSLGNIALQMFSKAGGKPWKMKPATNEYLIIGIGQSYNIEHEENGNVIEKNITYSVLTDSSGIFKDLQVLGEGVETDDTYYKTQVANIVKIINSSSYKKIVIHTPFRLSKNKILDKVAESVSNEIELSVLVINNKTDHFGFDYANNGLIPFESTFVKLASDEYVVWFEGLQNNTPKITKRFSNPLLIKFWYTNKNELFQNYIYKENLLQDCINLSGANWRGFKAKQLPVSVFYCQRIAEFIGKFREYKLEHIDINNLKPWFL
ncbi:MAG: hypothetical protein U0U66_00745 [Cytophagaceae bacterium]